MSSFIVVGDATVDQMYFVDELPELGGEVFASRASMEPGGAGATVAAALSRLGHHAKIATRIGQGAFSELALKYIRKTGVDMSLVQYDDLLQTSSITLVITPDAQRTMIGSPGASRELNASDLRREDIASADALVMSAYSLVGGFQREYALKAFDIAKEERLTTIVDMGSGAVDSIRGNLTELFSGVDYLLMNEHELFALTQQDSISEAVDLLARQGIERVVIKLGAQGSMVVTPEENAFVDPLDREDIIDSTGAGDYFTAAFAHGIMKGYSTLHAARLGNIAGALNATAIGAQRFEITEELLDSYLEDLAVV